MKLVKYEAACLALAECKSIDEVREWADKAAALQAYGRMAQDKTLEIDAAEIRMRAERRLGQMLQEQKKVVGLNRGGATKGVGRRGKPVTNNAVAKGNRIVGPPTLAEAGIDKRLSVRAQTLAAVPEAEFEREVAQWRTRVEAEKTRVTARLHVAGARQQRKAKQEKPKKPQGYVIKQSPPSQPVEDVSDVSENDLIPSPEELMEIQKDNERLQAEIAEYRADDRNAALVKAIKMRDHYQRRLNEQLDMVTALQKRVKFFSDLLRKCAQRLGVDDPTKVVPALDDALRTKAAA